MNDSWVLLSSYIFTSIASFLTADWIAPFGPSNILAFRSQLAKNIFNGNGRRGIAPTRKCTHLFKNVLIHFKCIKLKLFSYNFSFFIWFTPLMDMIGIKPNPSDHKSNFKKVGAIPCGCNTKWTLKNIFFP